MGKARDKNTGTESWQIKSISELNDFRLEHLEHPLLYEGRLPMKVGNKVKPGEAVAVDIYVKPNLSQGIHEETFVMETEEGIQGRVQDTGSRSWGIRGGLRG